jgi:hypothetical protein
MCKAYSGAIVAYTGAATSILHYVRKIQHFKDILQTAQHPSHRSERSLVITEIVTKTFPQQLATSTKQILARKNRSRQQHHASATRCPYAASKDHARTREMSKMCELSRRWRFVGTLCRNTWAVYIRTSTVGVHTHIHRCCTYAYTGVVHTYIHRCGGWPLLITNKSLRTVVGTSISPSPPY